jgi:hypothetical protein
MENGKTKRMNTRFGIILAVAACTGLTWRAAASDADVSDPEPEMVVPAVATVPAAPESISPEISAARREIERLQAERDAVLNWVLQNMQHRLPVPETLLTSMDAVAVDDAFELDAELAALVHATPEEIEVVNDALALALRDAQVIWQRIATAVVYPDGDRVVTVPPHEAEGGAVRARFDVALREALGEARADLLWKAAGRDLNRRFVFFGAGARVIRFTPLAVAGGGAWTRVRDELVTADISGVRHIEAIEFEISQIPEAYGFYHRLAESAR